MLRVAGFARQLIVSELVNVAAFRLAGDLLKHRTWKNFRAEYRRDLFSADLFDEPGNLPRARIRKIRRLNGADYLKAVAAREIRPRVVIREQAPVAFGNRLDRFLDGLIEGFEPFEKLRGVLFISVLVPRIETTQLVPGQHRVAHRVLRIQPQVRVGMALLLGKAKVEDVIILFDGLVAEREDGCSLYHGSASQILRRCFEIETVQNNQISAGQKFTIRRNWLEGVRVDAFRNNPGQIDLIPGDVFHDAGDRRDSGDDLELLPGGRLRVCPFFLAAKEKP